MHKLNLLGNMERAVYNTSQPSNLHEHVEPSAHPLITTVPVNRDSCNQSPQGQQGTWTLIKVIKYFPMEGSDRVNTSKCSNGGKFRTPEVS